MLVWLMLWTLLCAAVLQSEALLDGETRSIAKCLESYGGPTLDNAQRLERYTQWADKYEEVPCFTRCYLSEMFDFYDEQLGFDARKVVARFGQAIYDACSERLALPAGQNSSCEHAYGGFHCVVSLENDPFILIENMPNVTRAAKSIMKECLQLVDQVEWSRIGDYAQFPVQEPIPCYTRCFISKLHLFNERTRRWQLNAMREALGLPLPTAATAGCSQRRARNPCSTVYQQFTCYVLAK